MVATFAQLHHHVLHAHGDDARCVNGVALDGVDKNEFSVIKVLAFHVGKVLAVRLFTVRAGALGGLALLWHGTPILFSGAVEAVEGLIALLDIRQQPLVQQRLVIILQGRTMNRRVGGTL